MIALYSLVFGTIFAICNFCIIVLAQIYSNTNHLSEIEIKNSENYKLTFIITTIIGPFFETILLIYVINLSNAYINNIYCLYFIVFIMAFFMHYQNKFLSRTVIGAFFVGMTLQYITIRDINGTYIAALFVFISHSWYNFILFAISYIAGFLRNRVEQREKV